MKWDSSALSNHIRSFGFSPNPTSRKSAPGLGKDFAALLAARQNFPIGGNAASKSTAAAVSSSTASISSAPTTKASVATASASAKTVSETGAAPAGQRIPDERVPTLPAYMNDGFEVFKAPIGDEAGSLESLKAEKALIEKQIATFEESEWTYNDLWKSVALAGGAPDGYVSPNIGPGIMQGPGVTDQVDGVTVPRSDLYYAHDFAAQTRQTLRNGGTPTLPPELAANPDVQEKFDAYVAAFKAMPTFAGPVGMHVQGSAERRMNMMDAMAIQNRLNSLNNYISAQN